jgi:hypothetical protein
VALSLGLFALALAVAPSWRREALRAYGIGFVFAGALALILQDQAGPALAEALTQTAAVEPAALAAWTLSTTLLVQAAWATLGYGVFMIFAAWLAGPSRPTVAVRRAIAPYARHPGVAYAALAVFVVLLLWWAPTPATRDPALALILIALLVVATEALRRKIAREYPDADMGEAIERMHERARHGVAWVRQGTTRTSSKPSNDDRVERLERLARLKESGAIDEQEFAAEKRQILAGEPDEGTPPPTALTPS